MWAKLQRLIYYTIDEKKKKKKKRRQEQWPILALPDGRIVAKYDLLIGTWRTAIWHSKKGNFAVSSTDCSFKYFAVLSKIACMSTEFRCLDPD